MILKLVKKSIIYKERSRADPKLDTAEKRVAGLDIRDSVVLLHLNFDTWWSEPSQPCMWCAQPHSHFTLGVRPRVVFVMFAHSCRRRH